MKNIKPEQEQVEEHKWKRTDDNMDLQNNHDKDIVIKCRVKLQHSNTKLQNSTHMQTSTHMQNLNHMQNTAAIHLTYIFKPW